MTDEMGLVARCHLVRERTETPRGLPYRPSFLASLLPDFRLAHLVGDELTMALGKGSLSKLEQLKAEHADEFRAAAPKTRRIEQECFDLLCPTAIGRVGLAKGDYLRVEKPTCTRKRCPRQCGERNGQAT